MTSGIQFVLNGEPIELADCSTNLTLLEYLRSSGRTGSKEGCAEGDCGACSVAIVDRDGDGKPVFRAINSCLVPVCLMHGREIVTVEGISRGCKELHPVQQSMVEKFGSQCGYCTPGFIVSMFEGYHRKDIRTRDQLDDQLCGNLCRCTGYRPIVDAAIDAYSRKSSSNLRSINFTPLAAAQYQHDEETFLRPTTLKDLLCVMGEQPQARLIAGATELGLEITKKFKKLNTLISVEAVAELKEIKCTDSQWQIGAAVTLTEIEEKMAAEFPALGDMLRVFGSRQIRNRATMGGNIVTASPIGDSAPVLLALDAQLVLASIKGERTISIDQFFLAYRKTALEAGEILKTIIVPRGISKTGLNRQFWWQKISKRREMDISTVAACFVLEIDSKNVVRNARLAYGGVAAMPSRARKTEAALLNKPWTRETVDELLPIVETEFTPISDARGTAEYRRGLISSLLEKFFVEYEPADSRRINSPLLKSSRNGSHATPHESGHKHVAGSALYADDQMVPRGALEVWPVCSPHAHAKILKRDATEARKIPGVKAVLLAEDVPGVNDVGMKNDEPLLATDEACFHGQIIALVVGESLNACRAAAEKVVVEYEPLKPVLTLREALTAKSFHNKPNYIRRGEVSTALKESDQTLTGEFELGGQEHFYLEMQAAWAEPGEDGAMLVASSTQHPSEVQAVISHMLHLPSNKVVVQCPRMGGGFGGKETQAATPAAMAALAAWKTGRAVRVHFNRDQDMILTGHRHPFHAAFKVGFNSNGELQAARVHLTSNGGWAMDLSQAVTDRALFHLDNSYYIPSVEFRGQVAKTNISSNTAFRGFGGPQGMLVIEEIMDRVARKLGLPPEIVRERNLYRGKGETNTTHYGQKIEDNRIQTIWHELKATSQLQKRRQEIAKWNAEHPNRKRGIAITPVKFGISFTVTHLNQAGALVLIYQDGTVQVNHGGTEMGQGLHTNIRIIASKELGAPLDTVRLMTTSTDKVPNTSATAASVGTDINGAAVKIACETLRARLVPIAVGLWKEKFGQTVDPRAIVFADGKVFSSTGSAKKFLSFAEVAKQAYLLRTSLSATGYYATPGIHWDRVAGKGKPFHYFAYGASVSEVEVDRFTGMHRVLRVDILHDVGDAVNEGISKGQVEGGFVQGMGWLTTEELKWDDKGRLLTHSPDTYKIPAIGDMPEVFNVNLLKNAAQKSVVYGSKAVGEPPLMLAISVREAIRDAVAAFGKSSSEVPLASPATCEAIWTGIKIQLAA
jgi:xanthine dehydrogenase molybdopterin binding subunit/xanthine dehydrogenase small subunit